MFVPKLYIKKMIEVYGQTVQRKARIINHDSSGNVYYTYEVREPIRGHFDQITATDESIQRWGRYIECDCIGCFLPDTEIYEGDLLYINDAWYEVVSKVERRTKGIVDFVEVLLRRKD